MKTTGKQVVRRETLLEPLTNQEAIDVIKDLIKNIKDNPDFALVTGLEIKVLGAWGVNDPSIKQLFPDYQLAESEPHSS